MSGVNFMACTADAHVIEPDENFPYYIAMQYTYKERLVYARVGADNTVTFKETLFLQGKYPFYMMESRTTSPVIPERHVNIFGYVPRAAVERLSKAHWKFNLNAIYSLDPQPYSMSADIDTYSSSYAHEIYSGGGEIVPEGDTEFVTNPVITSSPPFHGASLWGLGNQDSRDPSQSGSTAYYYDVQTYFAFTSGSYYQYQAAEGHYRDYTSDEDWSTQDWDVSILASNSPTFASRAEWKAFCESMGVG